MGGGTGSIVLDPQTGEPVAPLDLTGKHRSVLNSYILDTTPGSTGITTYEGHMFDVFNPSTWVFDLEDISQALSNTCRFGGHVEFYSVAEHSCRVAKWLEAEGYGPRIQMLGLMHDAVEAYIGDICRPIKKKSYLGDETVADLERSMEYAMFRAFDMIDDTTFDSFEEDWKVIKNADMAIYAQERDERPKVGMGMMPRQAKGVWLAHYEKLQALIG